MIHNEARWSRCSKRALDAIYFCRICCVRIKGSISVVERSFEDHVESDGMTNNVRMSSGNADSRLPLGEGLMRLDCNPLPDGFV